MKAAVFHKPNDIRYEQADDPKIEESRDAIIRVTSTAICGSDLHILDGVFPQLRPMILGHEFMGIVEETGKGVTNLKKGDRVVVPFPIACGECHFCKTGLPPHCENSNTDHYGPQGNLLNGKGGALFGYTDLYGAYQGGQAEYVRVPFADYGPRKIDDSLTDEQVLFLTDIFPTGWSSIDWANLKGGETVVIFGAGPVGLMAQKSAWIKGAGRVIAVDPLNYRLDLARRVNKVETLNPHEVDVIQAIYDMTGGYGADVAVDAVGAEAERTFLEKVRSVIKLQPGTDKVIDLCMQAVKRAGIVTVVGAYGSPYDNFPVHRMFDKGLTLRFGQALVHTYIDELIEHIKEGRVVLDDIITHTLPLSQVSEAYKMFRDKEDNCTKVVLKP